MVLEPIMAEVKPPTLSDPAVIVIRDGKVFVCWVEAIASELRWVFVSTKRVRYDGGLYAGEQTLDEIRARVTEWWARKREPIQRRVNVERIRDWSTDDDARGSVY